MKEIANILSSSTFATHECLSPESYQSWQYCEVADIEPFQGQSDQIFQFSITRISFVRNGENHRIILFLTWRSLRKICIFFPLLSLEISECRKRSTDNFSVSLVLLNIIRCKWKECTHKDNIKKDVEQKHKNGNFWARLSERYPPSWSRLTTDVDQRNFAISHLSFFFSICVSFSLSLFSLLHSFSRSFSLFFTCLFCPFGS